MGGWAHAVAEANSPRACGLEARDPGPLWLSPWRPGEGDTQRPSSAWGEGSRRRTLLCAFWDPPQAPPSESPAPQEVEVDSQEPAGVCHRVGARTTHWGAAWRDGVPWWLAPHAPWDEAQGSATTGSVTTTAWLGLSRHGAAVGGGVPVSGTWGQSLLPGTLLYSVHVINILPVWRLEVTS